MDRHGSSRTVKHVSISGKSSMGQQTCQFTQPESEGLQPKEYNRKPVTRGAEARRVVGEGVREMGRADLSGLRGHSRNVASGCREVGMHQLWTEKQQDLALHCRCFENHL